MSGFDSAGLTNMSEDIDTRLSEEQKDSVRRLCAANAVGDSLTDQIADATALMLALGVHPSQENDDDDYLTSQLANSPNRYSTPPRNLEPLP